VPKSTGHLVPDDRTPDGLAHHETGARGLRCHIRRVTGEQVHREQRARRPAAPAHDVGELGPAAQAVLGR
jgi:hypothetical protein